MKTFSDYIGQASLKESRQKYIFGGTDDRNTNVSIYDEIYPAFREIIDDAIEKNKFYDDTPGFLKSVKSYNNDCTLKEYVVKFGKDYDYIWVSNEFKDKKIAIIENLYGIFYQTTHVTFKKNPHYVQLLEIVTVDGPISDQDYRIAYARLRS